MLFPVLKVRRFPTIKGDTGNAVLFLIGNFSMFYGGFPIRSFHCIQFCSKDKDSGSFELKFAT
jgi:hypothetical protein